MTDIILRLPEPPSVNAAYSNATKGRIKTKTYRDWQTECHWIIKGLKPGRVHGRYFVTIFLSESTRKDVDNCTKASLDMLAVIGITPDDKQCAGVMSSLSPDVEKGRCKIVIRQLSADVFPFVCFSERAEKAINDPLA